ncbi:MAG: 50S ribosome-binding GTPase [Verrucomicrobia bacterium]|nr:50S ribosome-binding GTPase [Verrucomicrobiota bacterium]MCH8512893.1 50S ribosome-binding GTPase [Kiritimatiellia bacterium]
MNYMLVGMESSGKTALVRALSGRSGESARFRGTTLACETYRQGDHAFIDSPGILRSLDSETTRTALESLKNEEQVILVLHAGHLDTQLPELLPLMSDKRGLVVLTHWDRVLSPPRAAEALAALRHQLALPVIALDARKPVPASLKEVQAALLITAPFPAECPAAPALRTEPTRDLFSIPALGPVLALILLFAPAWLAVVGANAFADALYDPLYNLLEPLFDRVSALPEWLVAMIAGDYGFVSMFPFLLLYALPTVLVFALFLSLLKTSGLVDRLTVSLENLLRPVGLSGRDLVRVVMGFGCNVPAVINTRACSSCSRGATVHAISFGSACSYQLPATLAVFAAAGMPGLAPAFILWLGLTTLVYVRLTTPKAYRDSLNTLKLPPCEPVQWPSLRSVVREAWETLRQFLQLALPVFFVICFVAALLQLSGLLGLLVRFGAPLMELFNLPGEAATAVILGSIRKDGLAIALLDADWNALKVPLQTPVQVLTAVYLAGVLLPCLVTLWTIAREFNSRYALRLCLRQVTAAAAFSLLLAWGGVFLPCFL